MTKKEYQALKEKLEAEYKEKLNALNMVWEMVNGKPAPGQSSSATGSAWNHPISKRDAVREAVKAIHGEFNMHRVRQSLDSLHAEISKEIDQNALSAILSKLSELGEIAVVKAKVGKAPAVYKVDAA